MRNCWALDSSGLHDEGDIRQPWYLLGPGLTQMMVCMLVGDVDSLQVPKNLLGPGETVEADQLAQAPLPTVQDHVAVFLRMFPFNKTR
jgi:hypothetical protein